jgi:hypothetical protein
VTVAREKMGSSAPAMNRTLLRALKLMGDPILLRAGKQLVPMPKALELRARIHPSADERLSIVRSGSTTSLAEEERTFTIHAEPFAGAFATSFMEQLTNGHRSAAGRNHRGSISGLARCLYRNSIFRYCVERVRWPIRRIGS